MRGRGIFSFIVYLLYLLFGGGLAIYMMIAAEKHNEAGGGWDGIGIALLLVFGICLAAYGLVGVVLKGVHLGTGWGFFAFLCILLDLLAMLCWLSAVLPAGDITGIFSADPADLLPALIPIAISLVSLISNAKSMRK